MAFTINPPNSRLTDGNDFVTPEWYRFFANIQRIIGDDAVLAIQNAPIVTTAATSGLSNERILTAGYGVNITFSAPTLTVALADSGVTAGAYGDDSTLVQITVDAAGRVTDVDTFALNSDNVTEGASNLFFTNTRARTALTGGDGIDYDNATGEIAADAAWLDNRYVAADVGAAWTAASGTASRATFATYTAPVISNPPTQAEVQAIADAVQALSQRMKAIVDDLIANRALTS